MRYFLDTEFDGFRGRLLSIALVREDGRSRYWADAPTDVFDDWVRENVVPILGSCPESMLPLLMATSGIQNFLHGDAAPIIVSDWPADIRYFCEAIELPGGIMIGVPGLTFEVVRVDAYPTTLEGAVQHNAWWDAMALRHKLMGLNPDSENKSGSETSTKTP